MPDSGAKTFPQWASAWVSPTGAFHIVPECNHYYAAVVLGFNSEGAAERAGWVHFSIVGNIIHGIWTQVRNLTAGQVDTLFAAVESAPEIASESAMARLFSFIEEHPTL